MLVSCQGDRIAKRRVGAVLEGMRVESASSSGGNMALGMAEWAKGTQTIINPQEELQAENAFRAWAEKKNLYRKISGYQILDTRSDGDCQVVSVTIEGEPYSIRVCDNVPMTWVD